MPQMDPLYNEFEAQYQKAIRDWDFEAAARLRKQALLNAQNQLLAKKEQEAIAQPPPGGVYFQQFEPPVKVENRGGNNWVNLGAIPPPMGMPDYKWPEPPRWVGMKMAEYPGWRKLEPYEPIEEGDKFLHPAKIYETPRAGYTARKDVVGLMVGDVVGLERGDPLFAGRIGYRLEKIPLTSNPLLSAPLPLP